MSGCDLAGYNTNQFDIPLLANEFKRCGISWPVDNVNLIDVYELEKRVNGHKLAQTFERYTGQELENAHDAFADVQATITILRHQLTNNPNLIGDISNLDEFIREGLPRVDVLGKVVLIDGKACWSFGKHKGEPVATTPPGYLSWFFRQKFPDCTREVVRAELQQGPAD